MVASSLVRPDDPAVLASAVADSLVVCADPVARCSGLFYWQNAHPYHETVIEALRSCAEPGIRDLGEALLAAPREPDRYAALVSALTATAPADVFAPAWRAETQSRMGYHPAPYAVTGEPEVAADDLRGLPAGRRGGADPEVLVVIPFRDRDTGGRRLRNLLACLLSLRDQSAPRDSYHVTVVESDDVPRWREVIEPYADSYRFAKKSGRFNKSWAMNAGVVHAPGDPAVICLLDADVLADRDFIARNAARYRRPGMMGHLPYRDMFCLDPDSTSWAIRDRLHRRAARPAEDHLRGFLLRRPPGLCFWVRAESFHRIHGMDERYEGWGGEDNDFAYRLDFNAAVDVFDDQQLHLFHPPASLLREDGRLVNDHLTPLSWRPNGPIGVLDRFLGE